MSSSPPARFTSMIRRANYWIPSKSPSDHCNWSLAVRIDWQRLPTYNWPSKRPSCSTPRNRRLFRCCSMRFSPLTSTVEAAKGLGHENGHPADRRQSCRDSNQPIRSDARASDSVPSGSVGWDRTHDRGTMRFTTFHDISRRRDWRFKWKAL